jgi:hypothetical protein
MHVKVHRSFARLCALPVLISRDDIALDSSDLPFRFSCLSGWVGLLGSAHSGAEAYASEDAHHALQLRVYGRCYNVPSESRLSEGALRFFAWLRRLNVDKIMGCTI